MKTVDTDKIDVSKFPKDVLDAQLISDAARKVERLKDTNIDLAIRVKEAREFLIWSTNHMRQSWIEWLEQSNKACAEVNSFRMAFERETKSIVAAGKDVRDFFNSPEYLAAHERLKETLGMLDRFASLKRDGTLDAFADFILKCQNP